MAEYGALPGAKTWSEMQNQHHNFLPQVVSWDDESRDSTVVAALGAILMPAFSKRLTSHPEIRAGVERGEGDHDDHGDDDGGHCAPTKHAAGETWVSNARSDIEPHFIVHDSLVHYLSVHYHATQAVLNG
jgi:hypothetical protein